MQFWTSDEVGELPYTGARCLSNLGIYMAIARRIIGISHLVKIEQLSLVEFMMSRILGH